MKKILILIVTILINSNIAYSDVISWQTTLEQVMQNAYETKLSQVEIDISKTQIMNAKSEYYPKLYMYAYNEYSRSLGDETSQVNYIGNEVIYGDNIYQNAISFGLS